jgi:hypothetical protein
MQPQCGRSVDTRGHKEAVSGRILAMNRQNQTGKFLTHQVLVTLASFLVTLKNQSHQTESLI